MNQEAALIIDVGTGSTRVAVVSDEGRLLSIKGRKNTYHLDERYKDAKYFLPEELKENIFQLIHEVMKETKEVAIKYVSSSAARESFVLIDADGQDYYGLPNIDNRGKEWLEVIPNCEYIEKNTGRPLTEDFGAMKLYGLKQKRAEMFQAIGHIVSISDWIGYIFTGSIEMEYSQASETQLFNIYTKNWDQKLCDAFGIDAAILPPVIKTGTRHELTQEVKERFNLDQKGLYVVGGADTQLAAQGIALKEDEIGLISGTSSPVVKYQEHIPDFEKNKEFNFWCSCNLAGDGYQVETNPGVTGLNLQQILDSLVKDVSYQKINQYIERNYHNLKLLASFTTQSPYKNIAFSNGGFLMDVPFSQEIIFEDFIHGIVADIAFSIAFKIRQNEVLSQTTASFIVGAGGGLRMETLCQMIADLTEKKLVLKENYDEASIIGAARVCFSADSTMKEGTVIHEYEPSDNDYLREKLERWLMYREQINSKKEIGAF